MAQALINKISNEGKKQRVYRLTVQMIDENGMPKDKAIVITNPMTLKFNVDRSVFAEINGAQFEIYNLRPDTYKQLFYDYFKPERRTVILEAGYETTGYNIVFIGDMWSCYTSREGTETVTRIECIVGLKSLGVQTDQTLAGVTRNQILRQAAKDMDMNIRIYSGEDKEFSRPVVLEGNSFRIIKTYSDDNAFIDNNVIYVLNTDDAYIGDVLVIDDEAGLLGVPEHEDALLTIRMLFEPRIMVGQMIEVQSRVAPQFNGQYKVYGIRHEGTISDAEAGRATTTLECWVGTQVYGRFNVVQPQY